MNMNACLLDNNKLIFFSMKHLHFYGPVYPQKIYLLQKAFLLNLPEYVPPLAPLLCVVRCLLPPLSVKFTLPSYLNNSPSLTLTS